MRPFPGLATQEGQTAQDRKDHIKSYFLLTPAMTGRNRKHHRYRTHNENKGHQTYEYQRQIGIPKERKGFEDFVRVWPAIRGKTDRSVGDQKCAKSKRIAHQEIPHHQLPIFHIEGAFSATPPFLSCWYRLCHILILLIANLLLYQSKENQ